MWTMDNRINNIKTDKAFDQAGQSKGGGDDNHTNKALPDFGPGGFDFFGVTAGVDKLVTGHDELKNHKKSGDNGDELDGIADESEKSLAFGTIGVFTESIGR